MRLLDRYLLRELLVPLGYCLSGFLLLCVSSDVIVELNKLQERKLYVTDIIEYYLTQVPTFLVLILPMALLLALLYTLTNHARHNEITAMRAAGVSIWRLCLPYLGVGFLASLALFASNEFWVPACADHAERILRRRSPDPDPLVQQGLIAAAGLANAREGRTWVSADYNPKTGEMRHPELLWLLPDGSELWLFAQRAIRTNGVWTFFKVQEFRASGQTNSMLRPTLQTNVLTLPELSETPEDIRSEIDITKSTSLRARAKADIPLLRLFSYLRRHPQPPDSIRPWLYTKLQGRLAAPWTCLVVVLIAIPFGIASGRRNVFVGVASSLVICFAYFVLQQFCLAFGAGGDIPPWVAGWLPNLAFGATGLWLTTRVR